MFRDVPEFSGVPCSGVWKHYIPEKGPFPQRGGGGGGGGLPYIDYIGVCRCKGYGFQPV